MEAASKPALAAALSVLGAGGMTIADVGARWGAADAWFRLRPFAKLVGFEPDPTECARLNSLCDPATEQFFPTALGGFDGESTLYLTKEPACSSTYPPSQAILDRYPSLRAIMAVDKTITVPMSTLANWSARSGIRHLDFIKLDTQGAEYDILRGAGDLLDDTLGIEAEIMFSPMYDGQPLFADVDGYLRSRGFTFWRFDSQAHYTDHPSDRLTHTASVHYESTTVTHAAGDGRLIWANAIYFRDWRGITNPRSLYVLSALLEAAGDHDGSSGCLHAAQSLGQSTPRPGQRLFVSHPGIDAALNLDPGAKRRITMTVGCGDCDAIPKVPGAGQIFTENGVRLQSMHNGLKVVADGYCGPWMTELIRLMNGHHEPQEERVFHELIKLIDPGSTMIELGSYWAYYAAWFQREKQGRTILVEPDPSSLAIGRRNFELNGLTGEFHHASVGRISLPPRPFRCELEQKEHLVPELSVDDLIRKSGSPRVELLLADIQGVEFDMLQGAIRSITRGLVRFMIVSTHHHLISNDPLIHQRCLAWVTHLGGTVLVEHNVTESFSGDGLIVVSFDPKDKTLPPIHLTRNWPTNSLFTELDYDVAAARDAIRAAKSTLEQAAATSPEAARLLQTINSMNPLFACL